MATGGYVLQLGEVPYLEAWELQRSLAGAVSQGAIPDTVVLLEHPPVVTLGRPVTGDEVRPHAVAALEQVFGLELEELPAQEGAGLWPQPLHAQLASR